MDSRVLEEDAVTGIRRIHHFDPADGSFTIETQQDVTASVEASKAAYNQFDERANWKGMWHRVASIPLTVLMDLKRRGIFDDEAAFKKWLNDADNRVFRTRPGRV